MALKTFVKVGNVNNLSDARYCAGMDVDIIGFPFDGPSAVNKETFKEIAGWVSGIGFAAEFSHSTPEVINEIIRECPVDYIQVSHVALLGSLETSLPVILQSDITNAASILPGLGIEYLLISGELEDLSPEQKNALQKLGVNYKVLLGASVNPENVEHLLEELPVHGISMNGSDEIRPGYKDYDELADILELLEAED